MPDDERSGGYASAWVAATEYGEAVRQLPFMLFTSWWNAVGGADFCPHVHHHTRPADPQLTVPAPVEGEHALFA